MRDPGGTSFVEVFTLSMILFLTLQQKFFILFRSVDVLLKFALSFQM